MRKFIFIALLISCRATVDDVAGVYVRKSVNEFGEEYDTLQVNVTSAKRDEFSIIRRWEYIRKDDTVYKLQRSFARYYPFDQRLRDEVRGKDYLIDLRKGIISDGNVIYER